MSYLEIDHVTKLFPAVEGVGEVCVFRDITFKIEQGGEDTPAPRIELGKHVVEQEQRRARQELRLRQEQRQHGEALLPLRAELPQVARAARHGHVVEMGAEPRRAALDVTVEPGLQVRA